jgi:branched-chain amino acid aminotransferase
MYDQCALLSTTKIRRNPVAALNPLAKCGNFLNNIMAYSEARRNGCHEAIMFSMEGYIAEGATSNIFLVENDQVYTPSVDTGIMPGITRGVVLELCKQLGISIHEKKLLPENLFSAQEIFYTNTSATIMPVGRIDNRSMPQPVPGPITQRLRKEISSIIEQETDPLWVC